VFVNFPAAKGVTNRQQKNMHTTGPTAGNVGGAHSSDNAPGDAQLPQRQDARETPLGAPLDNNRVAVVVEQMKAQHAVAIEQMKAQHADAIAKLEARFEETKAQNAALAAAHAALAAAHKSTVAQLEKDKATLEAQVQALQAHATSKLTDIHTAVAALHTLLPPAVPPLPSPPSQPLVPSLAPVAFDRDWCDAACGTAWKVDTDAVTSILRVHVTRKTSDAGILTLRGANPLPRCPAVPLVADGCQPDHHQLLPAYCVVVESYNAAYQWCSLGFVPSHHVYAGGAAVTAVAGRSILEYGGWYITVYSAQIGNVNDGWTAVKPSDGTYATTAQVPAVPAGSAVEFAVDYAAGACRVAFYTPAAVAGGFVDAPYAKMELRFVATDRPARPVPTVADSGVELYPAASTCAAGAIWRFAS
jgi:hypothetical protein